MWSNWNPHLESINGSFSSLGLTCSFFLKKPIKQRARVFNCLVARETSSGRGRRPGQEADGILQKLPLGELEAGAACYLSAVSFWNLPAAYHLVVGGTSEGPLTRFCRKGVLAGALGLSLGGRGRG